MRYISLFSGIEAASAAWEPLGWEPVAFAEVEPFPAAVLAARWPGVPNLGDVTKVDWSGYRGRADVVVGGSPCQSFSVAGGRESLGGESRLMFEYLRAVRELGPRWVVWENVPGVLSTKDNAFGQLLGELADCGYHDLSYRVLDAQFFGVAQRRRRVFVVGRLGGGFRSAAVLLEPGGLRGDNPPSREKRQELARAAGIGASSAGFNGGAPPSSGGVGYACELAPTLRASASGTAGVPDVLAVRTANTGANGSGLSEGVAHALDASGSEAVCYSIPENAINRPGGGTNGPMAYGPEHPAPTLRASGDVPAVAFAQNSRDEVRLVGGDGQLAGALAASPGAKQQTYVMTLRGEEVAGTLTARHDSSPCADRGANVVCVSSEGSDVAGALCAADAKGVGNQLVARGKVVCEASPGGYVVRRLTPVECERLQGFPDGWTDLAGCDADAVAGAVCGSLGVEGDKGRAAMRRKVRKWSEACPDTPRYKALGNSMAVPVVRWLGERIEMADELVKEIEGEREPRSGAGA